MKLLVLGGTQFLGRHVVEALLAAGHGVTTLNRGLTPDPLHAGVERLRGDRDAGVDGLRALQGRCWDACVDLSGYTPRQVSASADLLCGRVPRYVYMSAVSVYGDPTARPVRESQPRQAPGRDDETELAGDRYGALKVRNEDIVSAIYGDRATLLRPQVVAGPHDPLNRYSHWVQRAARGGEMLAPGDGSDHLQVIDVRDLARFVVTVVEHDRGGAYNLAGPRLRWADFMQMLGARDPVWVPASVLAEAGLDYNELPLYRPEHGLRAGLMDVDHQRAIAAGLVLSAAERTAADTRAWILRHPLPPAMSAQREAELIALSRRVG